MTTHLSSAVVQTRKTHRCYGCDKQFPNGSILLSDRFVDEAPYTLYRCQDCYHWFQENSPTWDSLDWECFEWGSAAHWVNGVWTPDQRWGEAS